MKEKAAATLLALLMAAKHVAAEPPVGAGARPSLGIVFDRALQRAMEKLESPSCRLVLNDFQDGSGLTLAAKLAETGRTAQEFLTQLEVRDGRNEELCRRGRVSAFTTVEGSVIWACPGGSLWLGGENNRSGANTLIHEMLHALGLRENPPTSAEINQRVRERCGL